MERELILVYNADSGLFDVIKDALHKTFFPSTYQCNLCALTYGKFSMKDEWKEFVDKLDMHYLFLHRDEFYRKLESHPEHLKDVEFPAIFLNKDGKITLFIDHKEINKCKTLKELMALISNKFRTT